MKKKALRTVLLLIPILLIVCAASFFAYSYFHLYHISYDMCNVYAQDSEIKNPYQGWYHIYSYLLSDGTPLDESAIKDQLEESSENELAQIQISLRNYKNTYLSTDALTQMDQLFSIWEKAGKQLIVRFLYDWDGDAVHSEPSSIDIIENHIRQAASIVNQHTASIYILQGIFVGDYGEMHDSNYMDEESMCRLANLLHEAIDPSIFLSVRTPSHWRKITGQNEPLTEADAYNGTKASRIGLFNDGMMGSETDLGTYLDASADPSFEADAKEPRTRKEELAFQKQLCRYVPNGGEAVHDSPYNDFENARATLFAMHVSYLHSDYDRAVLDKWAAAECSDDGKACSGLAYIGAHLGYRYGLISSSCTYQPFDTAATLTLTIENSGFSSCYRPFTTSITLEDTATGRQHSYPVDTDARLWAPGGATQLSIPIPVADYAGQKLNVWLKITDPASGRSIRLATAPKEDDSGYLAGVLEVQRLFGFLSPKP